MHFVIFVRTMLWVGDSAQPWCVHSPKQLKELPAAVHFFDVRAAGFLMDFCHLTLRQFHKSRCGAARMEATAARWL